MTGRICIFGAGAIGGHLAAKLARSGAQVSLIARRPHVEAIRSRGLRLISETEDFSVEVTASHDPAELPPQDLIVTTAKAHALPAAAQDLKALAGADTPILYVVNGIPWWYFHRNPIGRPEQTMVRLDPQAQLWNDVGVERAIGGVIYSSNEVVEPGVIRNGSRDNRLIIGEPDGASSQRLAALEEIFRKAQLDTRASPDIRKEVWLKLLGNLASSTIGCLTGLASDGIGADDGLRRLYVQVLEEGTRVAAALGVSIAADAEARFRRMKDIGHKSSMLQDLEAGRPLEADAQLLAVQDFARSFGVNTPTLDILIDLLLAKASHMRGLGSNTL